MNPSFNHIIHSWSRSLSKVVKINLGRYGISPLVALRGVVVDWEFLNACIRLWDPEAHVFRFGSRMEEMCPLFEEFCSIVGCDPNGTLVRHEIKVGYLKSFGELFHFSRAQCQQMVVEDQKIVLSSLVDEFLEVLPEYLERLRLRMRAFVFCILAGFLFNRDPDFGDLKFCPLIRQMEDMGCIGGMVLAETLRSLDRAALGFTDWTVSPIILQVFYLSFSLWV